MPAGGGDREVRRPGLYPAQPRRRRRERRVHRVLHPDGVGVSRQERRVQAGDRRGRFRRAALLSEVAGRPRLGGHRHFPPRRRRPDRGALGRAPGRSRDLGERQFDVLRSSPTVRVGSAKTAAVLWRRIDRAGVWKVGGDEVSRIEGCLDVDLNFSPSTNLLPIRRLRLSVGQERDVRAAWLRFPSFRFELLEQSYRRLSRNRYRYRSAGGRFETDLEVDDDGFPTRYPGFWERVG